MRLVVVWLDGSSHPNRPGEHGRPIRRRLRLFIGQRCVLSVPLRSVGWSR
jgi:hypothetical protein